MLKDAVEDYSTHPILSVGPESGLADILDVMDKHRVRRVMVRGVEGFVTIDYIVDIVYKMESFLVNSVSFDSIRSSSLRTIKPPLVNGGSPIIDVAKIMHKASIDFVVVDSREFLGIFTVRGLLRAIEVGELPKPALHYSTKLYPAVDIEARLYDAIKAMRTYNVRSVLVTEAGRTIRGVIPSKEIIHALAEYGMHAINEEIHDVVNPVEAFASPEYSIDRVAKIMLDKDTEVTVINVGREVVGVVDEWGVIQAAAGVDSRGFKLEE